MKSVVYGTGITGCRYPSNFRVRLLFRSLLLLVALADAKSQLGSTSSNVADKNVTEVIPLGSGVQSGYRIHFSYVFPDLSSVWLRGVGTVAPSGDLTYVIRETHPSFRYLASGGCLRKPILCRTLLRSGRHTGRNFLLRLTTGYRCRICRCNKMR